MNMNLALAENIRTLRKQKGLTQEQLADVFGVTTGAVHKWETGMSYPEISLLVEMADFFDTSIDYLLGYEIKDSRLETSLQRITIMLKNNDAAITGEIEKTLRKYPNSFRAVLVCAMVFQTIGAERHDKDVLHQALDLFERSLVLISQNNDPSISDTLIYGNIGTTYIALGEYEKGIAILKEHNLGGIFNKNIGLPLVAFMKKPEEAQPYISESLLDCFFGLFDSILAQAMIHDLHKDYEKEKAILRWSLTLLSGMKSVDSTGYLSKLHALLLIMMAHVQLKTGESDEADTSLKNALTHVRAFDSSPDYSLSSMKLTAVPEEASIHDFLGVTAQESIETLFNILEDERLLTRWKEMAE